MFDQLQKQVLQPLFVYVALLYLIFVNNYVLLSKFYLDFILILSNIHPDNFIWFG